MSKGGSDYTPGRTRVSKFSVGTGSVPSTEGSTRFGDTTDDRHEFTGSVSISGSLSVYGTIDFTGSLSGAIEHIASSTDNALVRWDGTDGEAIQNSNAVLTDTGYLYLSGNLDVSSSTKFGYDTAQNHQFTGSVYFPNSRFTSTESILSGTTYLPTTLLGTSTFTGSNVYASSSFEVSGSTLFGRGLEHTHQFTGSVYMTGGLIVTASEVGASEIYGTSTDAANAIGVKLGSSATYSTAGSKLLSVTNNNTEKSYIDYLGQFGCCYSDNGGKTEFKFLTEQLTMLSGASTDTAIQIPAGSVCYAVGVRVTDSFPMSGSLGTTADSTFSVGTSTDSDLWGWGILTTAGTTNLTSSMMGGFTYFSADTKIRITPAIYISNSAAVGKIRVDIRYMTVTTPTS